MPPVIHDVVANFWGDSLSGVGNLVTITEELCFDYRVGPPRTLHATTVRNLHRYSNEYLLGCIEEKRGPMMLEYALR